jgi:1-phosphofructokinase family hexose kinase
MDYPFDVVIIAANAAVDSYYRLSELALGDVNRAVQTLHTAGGKGNNLARAVAQLGGRPLSLGIVGGRSGQFILDELARERIEADFVQAAHETRRCSTIVASHPAEVTVVLEDGQPYGALSREALTERVRLHAADARFFVLTGSLPPDFPEHYYADLICELKHASVRVAVDCAGEVLESAIRAQPSIVKVNVREFQSAFGLEHWDWRLAATMYANSSLNLLIITDGAKGAYVFSSDTAPFRVVTLVDSWVNTTGAGDTFLAALLLALHRDEPLPRAVTDASAAAAASLQQLGSGFLELADVDRFLRLTRLEPLGEISSE